MHDQKSSVAIALIGGGPAALYMLKRIVDSGRTDFRIHIYERKAKPGAGMPYSEEGADVEHVTNISDVEVPELVTTIEEWIQKAPLRLTQKYEITPENFNELKVLPRLLFGEYLAAQFQLLLNKAKDDSIPTSVHLNVEVKDVVDDPDTGKVKVITAEGETIFDHVVLCTGHQWKSEHEGKIEGYFDSPYPPSKISKEINFPVAIKGSSLTAFDAIKTLARHNGKFIKNEKDILGYHLNEKSRGFTIVMHSIDGMLPTVRMHVDEFDEQESHRLAKEEMYDIRKQNDGFIPLDWLFEEKFKKTFKTKDPEFYGRIKDMSLETFAESIMSFREFLEPFTLLGAEYEEAEKSIKRQEAIAWKESVSDLNYLINYPAKYFSAEDMIRLKKVLMPLISIIIAFVPQGAVQEMMALHEAGILSVVSVDPDSEVVPQETGGVIYNYLGEKGKKESKFYKMFIDCVGQPPLQLKDIPFKSLVKNETVSPARIRFKSKQEAQSLLDEGNEDVEGDGENWYLRLSGIMINDDFLVVDKDGKANERIYVMAVPLIGGLNPDYSGLDFCESGSQIIMESLLRAERKKR